MASLQTLDHPKEVDQMFCNTKAAAPAVVNPCPVLSESKGFAMRRFAILGVIVASFMFCFAGNALAYCGPAFANKTEAVNYYKGAGAKFLPSLKAQLVAEHLMPADQDALAFLQSDNVVNVVTPKGYKLTKNTWCDGATYKNYVGLYVHSGMNVLAVVVGQHTIKMGKAKVVGIKTVKVGSVLKQVKQSNGSIKVFKTTTYRQTKTWQQQTSVCSIYRPFMKGYCRNVVYGPTFQKCTPATATFTTTAMTTQTELVQIIPPKKTPPPTQPVKPVKPVKPVVPPAHPSTPVDVCTNIKGIQLKVPGKYVASVVGGKMICLPPKSKPAAPKPLCFTASGSPMYAPLGSNWQNSGGVCTAISTSTSTSQGCQADQKQSGTNPDGSPICINVSSTSTSTSSSTATGGNASTGPITVITPITVINQPVTTTTTTTTPAPTPAPTTVTFTATITVNLTVSATATVSCPSGSTTATATATASGSASGTGSATSTISQDDANSKATTAANSNANTNAQAAANANATAAANAKCTPAPPAAQPPTCVNVTTPEEIPADGTATYVIYVTCTVKAGDSLTVTFGANYGSFPTSTLTFTSTGSDKVSLTYKAPKDSTAIGKSDQITVTVHDNTTQLNGSQPAQSQPFLIKAPKANP